MYCKLSCSLFSMILLAACQTNNAPRQIDNLTMKQFDNPLLIEQAEANLKQQIVMCVLPYLSNKGSSKINIAYRYNGSSINYESGHADLNQILQNCASPESGPKVKFSGNIEIWPDKKAQDNTNSSSQSR